MALRASFQRLLWAKTSIVLHHQGRHTTNKQGCRLRAQSRIPGTNNPFLWHKVLSASTWVGVVCLETVLRPSSGRFCAFGACGAPWCPGMMPALRLVSGVCALRELCMMEVRLMSCVRPLGWVRPRVLHV